MNLKTLMENYERFLQESYEITEGDIVEDVNPNSPYYGSRGEVVELKTELASAVIKTHDGRLLEKSIDQLVKRIDG